MAYHTVTPLLVCITLLCYIVAPIGASSFAENVMVENLEASGVTNRIRAHYHIDGGCSKLLLLGVGTGMNTIDYDQMANAIVQAHPVVVMIVDHNPFWLVKTSATRYANVANAIVDQISELLPTLCDETSVQHVVIGGHSASGQAAWNAIDQLNFVPSGYVGLDPFRLNPNSDPIKIPYLSWGFSDTSCAVTADQAAKAGYEASDDKQRVMYQVNNRQGRGPGHCSFTDEGCFGAVCPSGPDDEWVKLAVGETVSRFLTAIANDNDFTERTDFELILGDGEDKPAIVKVFVNDERVPASRTTTTIQGSYLRGTQQAGHGASTSTLEHNGPKRDETNPLGPIPELPTNEHFGVVP